MFLISYHRVCDMHRRTSLKQNACHARIEIPDSCVEERGKGEK